MFFLQFFFFLRVFFRLEDLLTKDFRGHQGKTAEEEEEEEEDGTNKRRKKEVSQPKHRKTDT